MRVITERLGFASATSTKQIGSGVHDHSKGAVLNYFGYATIFHVYKINGNFY
jgi:hypothetical protein